MGKVKSSLLSTETKEQKVAKILSQAAPTFNSVTEELNAMSGKETAGTQGISEQQLEKYFAQGGGPTGVGSDVVGNLETKSEKKSNDWLNTRYKNEISTAIKEQDYSQPKTETDLAAQAHFKKINLDPKKAEQEYKKYQKEMDTFKELDKIEKENLDAQQRAAQVSAASGDIMLTGQLDIPKGLSQEQKKQKKILEASLNGKLIPVIKEVVNKNNIVNKQYEDFLNKRAVENLKKAGYSDQDIVQKQKSFPDSFKSFASIYDEDGEAKKFKKAQDRLQKTQAYLNDYLNAPKISPGLLSPIQGFKQAGKGFIHSDWEDIISLGINGLIDDYHVYDVIKKKDRGETLSNGDNALVDSFSRQQSALSDYDLMKGKGWYKAGNGTAHSLVFMASLVATRGLGAAVEEGVEQGAKSFIKDRFKGLLTKGIRSAVTKEGKLLAETSLRRKLGLALVGAPINTLSATAGLAAEALISPMSYKMAVDEMIQGVKVDTDSKGKTTVYTPKALFNQVTSDYNYKKGKLEDVKTDILKNKSLSEEEKVSQLERINKNIEGLDEEFEQMKEDVHYYTPAEALWKGYTETMKENWSELYAGKMLPGIKLPGLSSIPKRYLKNKFLAKTVSAAEKAGSVYREGAAFVNNKLGMGTLSKKLAATTGENKIWHGLGAEVWEEIAVQAIPSYREDYMNQLAALKDPEFYQDVIAQTLMLGGGMSTIGVPVKLLNWKKQANFNKLKEEIRDTYAHIDGSISDADLAQQIAMTTGGTSFSALDYDKQISSLRRENTPESHKKAKLMEEKKFYNLALKAIKTDTVEEFEASLQGALDRHGDTENETKFEKETVMAIENAKTHLAELKKTVNRFSGNANLGRIIELVSLRQSSRMTIKNLEEEMEVQLEQAHEELEPVLREKGLDPKTFNLKNALDNYNNTQLQLEKEIAENRTKAKEGESFDTSIEDSLTEDLRNQEELINSIFDVDTPGVEGFRAMAVSKTRMESLVGKTNEKITEQIGKNYQERMNAVDSFMQNFQKTISFLEKNPHDSARSNYKYKNGKLIVTKEFIDDSFNRLSRQDRELIGKKTLDELKEGYYRQADIEIQKIEDNSLEETLKAYHERDTLRKDDVKHGMVEPLNEEERDLAVQGELDRKNGKTEEELAIQEQLAVLDAQEMLELTNANRLGSISSKRTPHYQKIIKDIKDKYNAKRSELTGEEETTEDEETPATVGENLTPAVSLSQVMQVAAQQLTAATNNAIVDTVDQLEEALQKVRKYRIQNKLSNKDFTELQKLIPDFATKAYGVGKGTTTNRIIAEAYFEALQNGNTQIVDAVEKLVGSKNIPSVTPANNVGEPVVVQQDGLFTPDSFDPVSTKGFSDDYFEQVKGIIKNVYSQIKMETGEVPTFRDLIYYMIDENGKESTDRLFSSIEQGWLKNNYAKTDFKAVYNEIFNPLSETLSTAAAKMEALLNTQLAYVAANPNTTSLTKPGEEPVGQTNTPKKAVAFNEQNIPIKPVAGNRIAHALLKFGFNAIPFEEVSHPDGTWSKETIFNMKLNEDSLVDFRDLLNPDMYNPGDKVRVTMAPESMWNQIKSVTGRNQDGTPILKSFAEILSQKEKENPDFRNTEDFRAIVPIFLNDSQGKPMAYVHDINWYNEFNVADPVSTTGVFTPGFISKEHKELIEQGRENVLNLRNKIVLEGLNQVEIETKSEGPQYNFENQVGEDGTPIPFMTIKEANPQSIIVVQGSGNVLYVGNTKFENAKRVIIGREELKDKKPGHTWHLRRIGTDEKGRETWRPFHVQREVTDEQIETVKWAWAAFAYNEADVNSQNRKDYEKKVIGTEYEMTDAKADAIIKQVRNITGLDLDNYEDAQIFFSSHFQFRGKGQANYLYSNLFDPKFSKTSLAQHTSKDLLSSKKNVVTIAGGAVQDTGMSYGEYLKTVLKTGVKSFNVGTSENPIYATSVQPVITFKYEGQEKVTPVEVTELPGISNEDLTKEVEEAKEKQAKVDIALQQAKDKLSELGFNFDSDNPLSNSFEPIMMQSQESLRGIFDTIPGLDLNQDFFLVKILKSQITNAIGFNAEDKFTKQKRNELAKQLKESIVDANKTTLETIFNNLKQVYTITGDAAVLRQMTNIESSLMIMDNISEYWYNGVNGAFDKALAEVKSEGSFKEELMENEENDTILQDSEELQKDRVYGDNVALTENPKNTTSARLKRFMSGIKRIALQENAQGVKEEREVKGFLNLTDVLDYNEVYDTIYQLLGEGVYIESSFDIMQQKILSMKEAFPWVKELMEKFDKEDTQFKKEFVYNYRKHAISMKFAMVNNFQGNTKLDIYDTNSNEITRIIRNLWEQNYKTQGLVKVNGLGQYIVNKETATELLKQFNSWGDEGHLQKDETILKWLEHFGIIIEPRYFKELKESGFMNKNNLISYAELFASNAGFIKKFADYLKDVTKREGEVIIDKSNKFSHPYADMNNMIKALSVGQARYVNKQISKSFRDGQKNISGITNPTFFTNFIDDLKRKANDENDTYINDLKKVSINSGSVILQLLQESPEFRTNFKADYLGITALKEYGKKPGGFSSINDLNSLDHDLTKLTYFQNQEQPQLEKTQKLNNFIVRMSKVLLPTMSDKTQMLSLNVATYDLLANAKSAFEVDPSGNRIFSQDFREVIYERLILPEMTRIRTFHEKNTVTNIKRYDKAAQIFNYFPALNNIKNEGGRVVELLVEKTVEEVESQHKEEMIDVVEQVLHNLVNKKKDVWESFIKRDKVSGKIKSLDYFDSSYVASNPKIKDLNEVFDLAAYDFVVNSVISNADILSTVAGDPALFADSKIPTPSTLDDNFFTTYAEKTGVNIGKRLALLIAPGATLADSQDAKYKQVFLADPEEISENSKYLISLYYGKGKEGLDKKVQGDITAAELIESYPTLSDIEKAVARKSLQDSFKKIQDYFQIEPTDAQEYTTASEHVYVLFNQGRLSQKEFDTISAKIAEQKKAEIDGVAIPKSALITKEELGKVMQPIKPVYTGKIFDQTHKDMDVARTVYIKSSSFPLLPQLTVGTNLDQFRRKLEELEDKYQMPVRASYASANKVGSVQTPIDPFNSETYVDIDTMAMLELNRNDFRIQQDVPFKSDLKKEDKISMGTQIFKLLFGDGVTDFQEPIFDFNEEKLNGTQLYQRYADTFETIVEYKKQELYSELGLDDNGQVKDKKDFVTKLQNLLQKEAINRDYPIQDIKGLELVELTSKTTGEPYYEFKVPLWLASNSNRYEALLNAIVSKRVMEFKMPGNSYVVGSETGFNFTEDLNQIDSSRVIYLDGWNGKGLQASGLNEDGSFKKAQVLAPSKFKDKDGKLINLFEDFNGKKGKYIERRKNGTLGLIPGMIDPSLLNTFSFRTPTSAHVSASSIEIVGILPPESGDLMIVPKNFTKQKGLDFDVDKENVYELHHTINYKTGAVEVLTHKHKDSRLKNLKALYDKEVAPTLSTTGEPQFTAFYQAVREVMGDEFADELEAEPKDIARKLNAMERDFDLKLAENDFINIHKAVFNTSDSRMQEKINKVLSMDFAREQADFIEGLKKEAEINNTKNALMQEGFSEDEADVMASSTSNNFTILSDEYQKSKMALGSAGKLAIGIYSNYVTFHALTQQVGNPISLLDKEGDDFVGKQITIGEQVSDGILGKRMTLDGSRPIAEAFAERQNTATDNEKEQILGRVNINGITIGVDSLLTALGFDKNENGRSVSYTLLSQPILREYVEKLTLGRGITATFNKDLEKTVTQDLIKKYGKEKYAINSVGNLIHLENPTEEIDTNELLTADNLEEGIVNNGSDETVQLAALLKFIELNVYAKSLGKVQSVLNTNNLGKSIVEANLVHSDLANLIYNNKFENITSLIGDFLPIDAQNPLRKGYTKIGDVQIKPTTPQGQIVVTGLSLGNELWSEFFPYSDTNFNAVVQSIMKESNIETDSNYKKAEVIQGVIKEAKKFIFSWDSLGLYDIGAKEERKRLFIDSPSNTSLANYLHQNIDKVPELKNNKLLQKFTYEVEFNSLPSVIKYNNTVSDNLEEKHLYTSIPELILNDRPLPDKNGKPYSTRDLGQELINYAFLEGGVQEAVQFIKYIPIEYLQEVGHNGKEGFTSASTILQRLNNKRYPAVFRSLLGYNEGTSESVFMEQFFQHNPDKVKTPSEQELKALDFLDEEKTQFTLALPSEELPLFLTMKKKSKKGSIKNEKFDLYKKTGQNTYSKIDVLGVTGMNEYALGVKDLTSAIEKQNLKPTNEIRKTPVLGTPASGQIVPKFFSGMKPSTALTAILETPNKYFSRYHAIAEVMTPYISDNTDFIITDDFEGVIGANANGVYRLDENRVYINKKAIVGTVDGGTKTILHELLHSIQKADMVKYMNYDINSGKYTIKEDAPAHVVGINSVFEAFRKSLDPKVLASVELKAQALQRKLPGQYSLEGDQEVIAYAGTDIFEFMAKVIEDKNLQKYMSEISYEGTSQSLLDKFKEMFLKIVEAVMPEVKQNTLAHSAITEVLNFMQVEKEIKVQSGTFVGANQFLTEQEKEYMKKNKDIVLTFNPDGSISFVNNNTNTKDKC
jgi:hypothetical protein